MFRPWWLGTEFWLAFHPFNQRVDKPTNNSGADSEPVGPPVAGAARGASRQRPARRRVPRLHRPPSGRLHGLHFLFFFYNIFLPFFFFLLLSPSATSVSSSSSSSIFGFIFPSKSNTFLLKFIIVLQKKMVQLFLLLYDDDDIDVSIFGSCFPSKSNTFDVNTFSLKFTVIFRQKKDCSTISATNSNQEWKKKSRKLRRNRRKLCNQWRRN